MELVKIRYEDGILYELDNKIPLGKIKVPRFILQPLVENSLTHGLIKKEFPWEIKVKCYIEGKHWIVNIYDNGGGFSPDVLEDVITSYSIHYTKSYDIKGIPREIDEAAMIDGCKPFGMITQVLMPILKPITVANIVITAISCWNDFMIPLFYLGSGKKWTVTLAVYNFFGMFSRNWNYVFAVLTLTVLPIVIMFLFLQKS